MRFLTLLCFALIAAACALAAAPPLLAQQLPDSLAQLPHVEPLVGLSAVGLTAAGTAGYQLIKKVVSPIDKLPGPLHAGVILAASIGWQAFAPSLSKAVGYTLPGDLSQIGPWTVTGVLSGLAMMGLHSAYKSLTKK